MKMVKTERLSYQYSRTVETDEGEKKEVIRALEDCDIEIEEKSFVSILGQNGSGKSTLAKLMNALLIPTEGSIIVNGYDTKNHEFLWEIRQSAGMVFQNPDNQLVATIVEEDVAFGPENLGVPSKEIFPRVEAALKDVGMWKHRKSAPDKLSGGQKQRVAIAGILAMRPKCIVFDEPTAMLDPGGRKEVLDTLLRINQQEGITVILITHFMSEAALADFVYVMDNGAVAIKGKPKEVFPQVERMHALGLEVPQVTEAAYLLRKNGIALPSDILTVEEMVEAICQYKWKR